MPSFLGHPRSVLVTVPAPVYATWNPAGTDGNITLSNGNLTAELAGSSGIGKACRTQIGYDFGSYYMEFKVVNISSSASSISIGIVDTDQNANDELGNLPFGYAWRLDGSTKSNGVATAYGESASNADIIMMAVRLYTSTGADVADIYFGKNGVWFDNSDPAAGSSPAYSAANAPLATDFIVAATFKTVGDKITANFGASGFVYPVPAGYGAGWGTNIS